MARPKFVAIDGNSLFYRAFYGTRYLSAPDGTPTNAVFGLTLMLFKLLDEKPDFVAVAFDTPKPTFRHIEFSDYKAQRKPAPDELIAQTGLARDLFRAFGVPVVEVEGYEADDIIGAFAKEGAEEDIDVDIYTGDLDSLQLINDRVNVIVTVKGVTDTVRYDAQAVMDRFGISVQQMTDFKGLKGDTSDNIPGVPGIGDKTAADLLTRYGTMENLLEHIAELPEGKIKRVLTEHADQARLSKWLATIECSVPVDTVLEDYRWPQPDYAVLRELFMRLGFKSMLRRIPEQDAQATANENVLEFSPAGVDDATTESTLERSPTVAADHVMHLVESPDDLRHLIESIRGAGHVALNCHVSHGKSVDAKLIGIAFCIEPGATTYVRVSDPVSSSGAFELNFEGDYEITLSELAPVLEDSSIHKVCHDLKLNYAALALRRVKLAGADFDTMLAAYLIDSSRGSFDLNQLVFDYLSFELPADNEPNGICTRADAIARLHPLLASRLEEVEATQLYGDIELPLAPILAEMEIIGLKIDVAELGVLSVTLAADIAALEESIYDKAGEHFNIGSPKQLQTILFEKMGIATQKRTKTGFSTSASVLEELAAEYPIVSEVLQYRELTKIKSTYADALPKLINPRTGRIHTSLNQAVTATGRLSSSDPNLQNIPIRTEQGRRIRKAFVAPDGYELLSADYSQIELRVMAHFTGDDALVHAFEVGEDIHTATACAIFGCEADGVTSEMRRRAKTINFAVMYGMADFTLARELGIPTKEARTYIDTYFSRMPGVRRLMDETIQMGRETGYVVTLMGRRRYVPDVKNSNYNIRTGAERAAVNSPIQGTAADIMKLAMIKVHKDIQQFGDDVRMVLQVHDELVFEVKPDLLANLAQVVKDRMENACTLNVPLVVDVKHGPNWSEMAPLDLSGGSR